MALRKCLTSNPSCLFRHISTVLYFILVVLIYTTKSSEGNIISITRRPNQDDSFEVMSDQGFLCSSDICSKYNANQNYSGISETCPCQCSSSKSTFYSKSYTCKDKKSIISENGCSIQFKDASLGTLPVINILSSPGTLRLKNKMSDSCSKIKTSWFYLKNGTWIPGKKNGIFDVTLKQHWTKPDLNKWFLKWYSGLQRNYTGIIIKIVVACEHDGILDQHEKNCLLFKTNGTYTVKQKDSTNPTKRPNTLTTAVPKPSQSTIPTKTNTESSTDNQPTPTTTIKQKVMSTILPATAIPNKPKKEKAETGDQRLWIAFAAGGVTVLFVLIACLVFFFLMCRQKKKQSSTTVTEITRNSSRIENANDPLHDYEYVVYPVLTEGYQSSSTRSIDNAMYERGPDNELIIRTPGISMESLSTNTINHIGDAGHHRNIRSSSAYFTKETAPLNHAGHLSKTVGNISHEYAQLQRKGDDVIDPCSGIYQPLIRPVTPDITENKPDKNEAISLELIDTIYTGTNTPDYMVLEPTDPTSDKDLNV